MSLSNNQDTPGSTTSSAVRFFSIENESVVSVGLAFSVSFANLMPFYIF